MRRLLLGSTAALLVLTGCAGGGADIAASDASSGDDTLTTSYGEAWPTDAGADHADAPASSTTALRADRESADAAAPAPLSVTGTDAVTAAGPLRAGSVDDNDRFLDYLAYRERFLATGVAVHDRDVSERHVVRVTDAAGRPVLGARVELIAGDGAVQIARTQADGRALLHPLVTAAADAPAFTIRVARGETSAEVAVPDRSVREHTVVLEAARDAGPTRLDVHFLIDATGSMDDEIARLKATMTEVAARIATLPSLPDVRWGMTAYRDRGDAFVTRSFDFTSELVPFTAELAELEAYGGGDTPEALNEALHAAVHGPAWDVERAVQIMFLIADAPPHLDYPDDADYADEMFVAAEKGITIVPIASSGLDDQGEYVFRQLAQVTLGRFMFLTYGPGGGPGDSTTHDVSGYEVLSLDELVVRYVTEQLAHREDRATQQ